MAKISYYLKNVQKFSAQGLLLTSDGPVVLRFATGDRSASTQTPHAQVLEMIEEIAPAGWKGRLARGAAEIEHTDEGVRWKIVVTGSANQLKVHIEPAPAKAVEERGIDMPALDEMVIERTSLATDEVAYGSKFLDDLLRRMKEAGCSDLHLVTGQPPMVRLHGDIQPLPPQMPALDGDALLRELLSIMPQINREEFEHRNDTDFAHNLEGVSRFRVNCFRDRAGPGGVFRAIPFEMPDPKKLGVPDAVLNLCELTKGLVVVTGPTGSGKSTTLASMIDHINQTRGAHIITIEDPIEFVHPNKRCYINQREVRSHTRSFRDALRAALREDPDIVLVGEMRDLETIAIAVETAETGHLVFGTLHTTTAPSTVERVVDQFPPDRQEQIRTMLAESLSGVVAQTLCKKIGGGRVAAYEVLIGTGAVSNLIREKKTFQLFSVMQTSRNLGMTTLNDSLVELVRKKLVEPKEAYYKAVNKAELRAMLKSLNVEV